MLRAVSTLCGVAIAMCVAGCSKDNAVDASNTTTAGIGQQCGGADDPGCGTGGVCVLGYCRLGCLTDAECPQGALCIGDAPPFGCSLDTELQCSDSKECNAHQSAAYAALANCGCGEIPVPAGTPCRECYDTYSGCVQSADQSLSSQCEKLMELDPNLANACTQCVDAKTEAECDSTPEIAEIFACACGTNKCADACEVQCAATGN